MSRGRIRAARAEAGRVDGGGRHEGGALLAAGRDQTAAAAAGATWVALPRVCVPLAYSQDALDACQGSWQQSRAETRASDDTE